mmetsp:Transcript_559/g.1968  ORF Transcript_559/g.1968 Transcript_559/m.1968 type:complete len:232 (+) Transcript_559:557-1252(+)
MRHAPVILSLSLSLSPFLSHTRGLVCKEGSKLFLKSVHSLSTASCRRSKGHSVDARVRLFHVENLVLGSAYHRHRCLAVSCIPALSTVGVLHALLVVGPTLPLSKAGASLLDLLEGLEGVRVLGSVEDDRVLVQLVVLVFLTEILVQKNGGLGKLRLDVVELPLCLSSLLLGSMVGVVSLLNGHAILLLERSLPCLSVLVRQTCGTLFVVRLLILADPGFSIVVLELSCDV